MIYIGKSFPAYFFILKILLFLGNFFQNISVYTYTPVILANFIPKKYRHIVM